MAEQIITLWHTHRQAALPDVPLESKGELWVLDEVVGGCVAYYLDTGRRLDAARVVILEDCLADLERLLPGLDETAAVYFGRLGILAGLVLEGQAEGGGAH
jgi:hypothetical protein